MRPSTHPQLTVAIQYGSPCGKPDHHGVRDEVYQGPHPCQAQDHLVDTGQKVRVRATG